jgi:hypothetical protein
VGTSEIEIGAHERRAAESSENATPFWRLTRKRLIDSSAKTRGFQAFFRQTACKGADKVSIGIEA